MSSKFIFALVLCVPCAPNYFITLSWFFSGKLPLNPAASRPALQKKWLNLIPLSSGPLWQHFRNNWHLRYTWKQRPQLETHLGIWSQVQLRHLAVSSTPSIARVWTHIRVESVHSWGLCTHQPKNNLPKHGELPVTVWCGWCSTLDVEKNSKMKPNDFKMIKNVEKVK